MSATGRQILQHAISLVIGIIFGFAGYHIGKSLPFVLVWSLVGILVGEAIWSVIFNIPSREKMSFKDFWAPDSYVPSAISEALLSMLDKDIRKHVLENEGFVKSKEEISFLVIKRNIVDAEYANLARNLVEIAKSSVYATNTYSPTKIFDTPGGKDQLKAMFEKKIDPNKKRRLQILDVEDKDQMVNKFRNDSMFDNFKNYHLDEEEQVKVQFQCIQRKNIESKFMGDYLVIDKKIVLLYQKENCLLELIVGEAVKPFLEPFDNNFFFATFTYGFESFSQQNQGNG